LHAMTTGSHRSTVSVTASAFDLIELNGDDLRHDPLQVRKATLASILAKARPGIRFNEHIDGDGPTAFAHACKIGPEGIVSRRKDSVRDARQIGSKMEDRAAVRNRTPSRAHWVRNSSLQQRFTAGRRRWFSSRTLRPSNRG
jgi:hypothetical protein